MSSAPVLTEKKLKAAAKRLPEELSAAGVDVSDLGYAKTLDILSKSLFGKPFTEVKATLLAVSSEPEGKEIQPAVVEIEHGSNIILAVDGAYVCATNPGTDMEIPYYALADRAASHAAEYGVGVGSADLSGLCEFADSDDEVVRMADKMGYFRPEGSFFEALDNAELILVDGLNNDITLHLNWKELVSGSDHPDGQEIWLVRTYETDASEPNIYVFTFGDLCRARKQGDCWIVPESKAAGEAGTPTHRIFLKSITTD